MINFLDFEPLLSLDQEVISKIVLEGEARLNAQLATANAADQRAMSFAGFLIGTTTATVGAAIALSISDKPRIFLITVAFAFACCLLIATFMAVNSVRPKKFSYPGNLPENWLPKEWNFPMSVNRNAKNAMIEQCYTLNQAICKNQSDMQKNAKKLKLSIDIAVWSTTTAAIILAIYSAALFWPSCDCVNKSAPPAPAQPQVRR